MHPPHAARPLLAIVAALAVGMLLSGCGADQDSAAEPTKSASVAPTDAASGSPSASASESASGSASASPTPAPAGEVVQITVKGDSLSPNAKQVKVKVGEQVTLHITSDRSGELHLHTTPDKHIEFGAGQTDAIIKLARPGRIELEEHESGKLLIQFVVQ